MAVPSQVRMVCDRTIMSPFVNQRPFYPQTSLEKLPRTAPPLKKFPCSKTAPPLPRMRYLPYPPPSIKAMPGPDSVLCHLPPTPQQAGPAIKLCSNDGRLISWAFFVNGVFPNSLGIPGNLHEPKLFLLLACLKFPLRDNIPKTFLFGIAEVGWFIFSICFELTRGSKPTFKGKLSLLFLSLGAHLDTRCMNYCPAQSAFLMETCLFVEISSLVVSWFGA
jgi:hypothetical protein